MWTTRRALETQSGVPLGSSGPGSVRRFLRVKARHRTLGIVIFSVAGLACGQVQPEQAGYPQSESVIGWRGDARSPPAEPPPEATTTTEALDAAAPSESALSGDGGRQGNLTHFGTPNNGRCCEADMRVLLTIPFEFGSTKVQKDADPTLRTIADSIAHHADFRLEVDGHADPGEGAAAHRLSVVRAEHVRAALITVGTDAARLTAVGCGTRHPVFQPPEGRDIGSCVSFLVRMRDEKPCAP